MKTSIATVSVSGNLREKLAAISAAGFDGVEIFEQDFIADDRSPREVGQMIKDHGLEITLFQPFRDFEGLPSPFREKTFDRARHKFDLMQELGTDLILFCSTVHPDSLGGIDRAAEDFARLGEIAAAQGIRVGYEALAWGKHVNDHRDAWEIVRRADHPNVGLIVDSFHTLGRGIDPNSIRRIPGDKIFFVQLADAPKIDMDLLFWSRHFRNMPGEGDLDVTGFMASVIATGYTGPISLEIFNDQFRGSAPKQVAQQGYRSLINLMDDVRRQEPEAAIDLPDMPERIDVQGVAFVEFASRGDEARHLEHTLKTLGFVKVGQHRTKALGLWQQGDIRILINEQEGDLAASMFNAHGTSVCDIGLAVGSATDTAKRARALGGDPFSQTLSPGQLDIPAIRGLGGGVMHFLDDSQALGDVWTVEFDHLASPDHSVGLKKVDHIAQTVSYDEMLNWSLFYTSLFAMKKAPTIDVTDPDGLVRSQALQATSDGLRITLNGAETHRTFAGSFLAESFGAPVQHIAFTCDDIFEAAQALVRKGFEPLEMHANYYADLNARFDLPAATLKKMQTLNILYDEEAGRAFYHLYSRPKEGALFFEILQRDQSYNGYGAPNAPYRIAAQKRLMRAKGMPRK